jgi:hypothetical protein
MDSINGRQNCHEGELASFRHGCADEATYAYLPFGANRVYLSCSRHRIMDNRGRACGWPVGRKVISCSVCSRVAWVEEDPEGSPGKYERYAGGGCCGCSLSEKSDSQNRELALRLWDVFRSEYEIRQDLTDKSFDDLQASAQGLWLRLASEARSELCSSKTRVF